MRPSGARKIQSKLRAREWMVDAIQRHSEPLDKDAQREVRRFLKRLQRDVKSLKRAEKTAKIILDDEGHYLRFVEITK